MAEKKEEKKASKSVEAKEVKKSPAKKAVKADAKKVKKEVKKEAPKEGAKKSSKKVKEDKSRGKKYIDAAKLVDRDKIYALGEALDTLVKTSVTKFDATCEVHIELGIKPEIAEQNLRMPIDLPAGTGKQVRVAAIVSAQKVDEAKKAGADIVGSDELIEKIEKGFMDFDIVIATPDMMGKMGKLGKTLGTKGLMPNPKTETVTDNPAKTVEKLKKGRVEARNDKFGIVHVPFGKVSMGTEKIEENFKAIMDAVKKAKPQGVKGTYIKKVTIATTMGPGIKVKTEE